MIWKIKTIPLVQLPVGMKGFITPLCSSCKNRDCEHPIETRVMPYVGIMKEQRILNVRGNIRLVVDCDGYTQ